MPDLPDPGDRAAIVAWVANHLGDLCRDEVAASDAFRGGQQAADAALAAFDVAGYAARRNEVWPAPRRGASRLSPYIRHGLLTLPEVWRYVGGGPARDVAKFRDELLWQEYARHLYARLGAATRQPLRFQPSAAASGPSATGPDTVGDGGIAGPGAGGARDATAAPDAMACLVLVRSELTTDGWLVNQTRMWFASQWTVRRGWDWRAGEDYFFAHLLDGSRAANRLGWQWTVGAGTGKPYGFSRWQVNKRAPGLCDTCALAQRCPIEDWPDTDPLSAVDSPDPLLRHDPDPGATAGPNQPEVTGEPDVVWLTAESLGGSDPALAAHPEVPVVFVFDQPLLARLRLSAKRLVFLAECLADLATERDVEVHRGRPLDVLAGRRLAATFTPVPGFRRHLADLELVAVHPWPWLSRPDAGSLASFSAWRRRR